MDNTSKKKAVQGVAWASASSWGGQLLSFAIYAGLARLLNPDTFGVVAIAGVYIAFIQLLVAQGFGMAIVQRLEVEEQHLNSAFWIAIATAGVLCLFSHLCENQIARFFGEPRVAPVIGWLSYCLFFHAMSSVQTAILTRDLHFRALAIRYLLATAISGAIGLTMAFKGWGVWSLVGQQMANAVLSSVFMWWSVSWRPSFQISLRHLNDLYHFSIKIAGNDLLWFFAQKSDQTMVGYGFGPLGLGPYSLASRLPTLLYDGIIGPLGSVAFPAFSKLQSDREKFENALYKFCEISYFVSFPIFTGLAAIAPSLVPVLFGAKWMAAIPLLQVLAIYGAARCALGFMHPLMLARGEAGLYLILNILLAAMTFLGCLATARLSPLAIAISVVVSMVLFGAIFLEVAKQKLRLVVGPILKSLLFPAASSSLMLVLVVLERNYLSRSFSRVLTLAVCIATGAVIYVATAFLVNPELIKLVWRLISDHVFSSDSGASEQVAMATPGYVAESAGSFVETSQDR
jgi:PST family polysaccharide transporter